MAFGQLLGLVLLVLASAACQKLGLVKHYEYDERVELSLDGSAIVDINASIPALVALRGATLNIDPEARFDRQAFGRLYEGPGVRLRDVSVFRRHGRRFVHVRLEVSDIAQLPRLTPFSWSRYRLDRLEQEFRFVQEVGAAARLQVGDVGWTGDELIAFRYTFPAGLIFTILHSRPNGAISLSGSRPFAIVWLERRFAWKRGWTPNRFSTRRFGSSADHSWRQWRR